MSTKKESGVISIMDEEKATELLSLLEPEKRVMVMEMSGKSFQKRLRYSPDEVGSIMSDDFILLDKSTTISDAFEKIREEAEAKDNIRTVFLTAEGEELYGCDVNKYVSDIDDECVTKLMIDTLSEYLGFTA